MTNQQLHTLLEEMSLEEKIGQMLQLSGDFYAQETVATGPCAELGIRPEDVSLAGSVLSVSGAETLLEIQKNFIPTQPHGIPLLFMADIINGYRTVFPIPLAQGASFNPELTRLGAQVAARESAAAGLHVTFSPMADLVRDARWGRVMESTGEDPYLNGCFAKSAVEGYQGKDMREKGRISACVKHFAGYGAVIAGREYNHVELCERTLREDYLPPYQTAIEADPGMVMTAFHTLNRIPATGDARLLRQILRGEMGFEGALISDWAAIREMTEFGYAGDMREAAALAIEAGVDIDMMTNAYCAHLPELVASGEVDEKTIDECVLRILELKNRLGLFENPYKDASPEDEKKLFLCREHREAAKAAAEETFVLLKNKDGILPLKQSETVVWAGPYAEEKNIIGAWSFFADPQDSVTIREGVERIKPGQTFVRGCGCAEPQQTLTGFRYNMKNELTQAQTEMLMQQAVEAAAGADKVVVAIGEHPFHSGEGASRTDITVPSTQVKLLERICSVNPNIAVVLFCGRPLDIRNILPFAKAVLTVWMPGTEGGSAIADVLYAKSAPSGRLSMSFPWCVGQLPITYRELPPSRPYTPQNGDERFLSRYMDAPNEPLFPFGFGLSYTEFSYGPVELERAQMRKGSGETLQVSVRVKNTGSLAAKEVVQMYVRDKAGSAVRPLRELKGFQKLLLQPGEEKTAVFSLTEEMLRFYGREMRFEAEPGVFEVYVGADSTTQNRAEFTLLE